MLIRPRRSRVSAWMRDMVAETSLSAKDLILPVFIREDDSVSEQTSMPGVRRHKVAELPALAREAAGLGIPALAIFPVLDGAKRTPNGDYGRTDVLACEAIRAIKSAGVNIGVITDVAMDRYTSHGQDGLVRDGRILNDESVELLAEMALAHAEAGADIVAPSDMMDGRIEAIRRTLDAAGHEHVGILSYSAKYASALYGPFRDAVNSSSGLATGPGANGKKTYFLDIRNRAEAVREAHLDETEGADILMVKPGSYFLDVILTLAQNSKLPVFAYQVSGEYAMMRAAEAAGWASYDALLIESLLGFKRAGAKGIFTYGALDAARLLQGK
ncbi:porphobilinogen synthase [Chitinimonas arctica]|uniref:Delta-aminolevulinic acid dehydratase n=2 Tax=Chitinimonas arctica TaxID=2594795 RepID=A0A516SMA7_9NEIS|nr:porphobilinogen synthase [Chitinimonas arctica]